jgi:hypothetical protein
MRQARSQAPLSPRRSVLQIAIPDKYAATSRTPYSGLCLLSEPTGTQAIYPEEYNPASPRPTGRRAVRRKLIIPAEAQFGDENFIRFVAPGDGCLSQSANAAYFEQNRITQLQENSMKRFLLVGAALAAFLASSVNSQSADKLLNASYDVARELFVQVNEAFVAAHPGVTIDQSHAGTSKQARAIVEGLEADVVTFNQVTDIAFLVKNGFVSEDWQNDFANKASPFYSLPSFLVRAPETRRISRTGTTSFATT